MASRLVIGSPFRKIGLGNVTSFVIMGIFVALAVTQRLGPLVVGVAEVYRNL